MLRKEGIHQVAVGGQEIVIYDGHAGDHAAFGLGLLLGLIPGLCQIQDHRKALVLGQGRGNEGLGEKADAAGILRQDRGHLRRLGFELQGHIILGQSGSGHQIAEGIFRSGALSGEVYGLSL